MTFLLTVKRSQTHTEYTPIINLYRPLSSIHLPDFLQKERNQYEFLLFQEYLEYNDTECRYALTFDMVPTNRGRELMYCRCEVAEV